MCSKLSFLRLGRKGLWWLTPLSSIFQLYRCGQFLIVEETGETVDLSEVTTNIIKRRFLRFPPQLKTVRSDITEILMKVALTTITPSSPISGKIILSTYRLVYPTTIADSR
jgi:hypothetical protein